MIETIIGDGGEGERAHQDDPSWAEPAPDKTRAAIVGLSGLALSASEADFLSDAKPWGAILFRRNIQSPEQVAALVSEIRDALGWRAPILIDQEGGRVARLRGPDWLDWPPVGDWCEAADRGALSEEALWEALTLRYRLIADEMMALGIDVNCAPLLDLRLPGAHDVIGDRALGATPAKVVGRASVIADALQAGGVSPIAKHIPGHGRADVDSHASAPRVSVSRETLSGADFAPFAALQDLTMAMTAHVVYEAIDAEHVATVSKKVIADVIRGEMAFDGLLMTDDVASMGAMQGTQTERARASLEAGCDMVLHCSGQMSEMVEAMRGVASLSGDARRRADAATRARRAPEAFDVSAALRRLDELAAPGWGAIHARAADPTHDQTGPNG